jgi:curved DNA-binding protein
MTNRYHQLLGVSEHASLDDIKKAFRRLARRYHPDVSSELDAKEKFIQVVEAYRVLSSAAKIDTSSSTAESPASKSATAKPSATPSGAENNSTKPNDHHDAESKDSACGKDCHLNVPLSIEELYWGTEVKIDPTTACLGRRSKKGWRNSSLLKISIQRGTQHGARLRLAGKGEAGCNGGAAGDVILTITLKPHERYEVSGDNLYVDMPLSVLEAKAGTITDVMTPGGRVEVAVPAGISSGQSVRIPQRGLPHSASEAGDLFAVARLINLEKRTSNLNKWPHVSHAASTRWQTVGNTRGKRIDIHV